MMEMSGSVRLSPESSQSCSDMTGCIQFHQTRCTQRQINYSVRNRGSLVHTGRVRSLLSLFFKPHHLDLMHEQYLPASCHTTELESGHFLSQLLTSGQILDVSGHLFNTCPSQSKIAEESGHPVTSATNSFSTPTSPPLLKRANHQVYYLVHVYQHIFTNIFKGVNTHQNLNAYAMSQSIQCHFDNHILI